VQARLEKKKKEEESRLRQYYIELLRDYWALLVVGAIVFLPDLFLPPLAGPSSISQVCGTALLCVSGHTPWGVITSIFLNDSWTNPLVYVIILVTYAPLSDIVNQVERRRRASFASLTAFLTAGAANALWILVSPNTLSFGPSGVVYALWGILLAFTLLDGLPKRRFTRLPSRKSNNRRETLAPRNLIIFACTVIVVSLAPSEFLGAGPHINVFVHSVSFLGGYLLTNAYVWNMKRRELLALR
jgi:membrane associated rhomboid family serine protease